MAWNDPPSFNYQQLSGSNRKFKHRYVNPGQSAPIVQQQPSVASMAMGYQQVPAAQVQAQAQTQIQPNTTLDYSAYRNPTGNSGLNNQSSIPGDPFAANKMES